MRDMNEIGQTFNTPICNNCVHHVDGNVCEAFTIIPNEILIGENNHSKPIKNQKNNIVFEPINKEKL